MYITSQLTVFFRICEEVQSISKYMSNEIEITFQYPYPLRNVRYVSTAR